jgi:type III pantothenate kinase
MSFLAIDVGNTRLKWALYDHARPGATLMAQGAEFLENIDRLAEGEWARLPEPRACWAAWWPATPSSAACRSRWRSVERRARSGWSSSAAEAGLTNGYDHPTRLGSDRWVAMIGARHRVLARGPARPLLVVMVGTAVTVEAIDAAGPLPGRADPARPRHHAARAGVRHRRPARAHGRGARIPDQHQRRADQRRHLRHCRRGASAWSSTCARRCGAEPACIMTGGAGWKMAPSMSVQFELVDSLIFDGLLEIAQRRWTD